MQFSQIIDHNQEDNNQSNKYKYDFQNKFNLMYM